MRRMTASIQKGFTLIEVLVSLLILAVGLLGMASLMTTSMHSSHNAYSRNEASLLAYDIADRMRLNREQAISANSYVLDTDDEPAETSCGDAGCTASEQAQVDLYHFYTELQNNLPGGTAQISRNNNQYTIELSWPSSFRAEDNDDTAVETLSFTLRVDL